MTTNINGTTGVSLIQDGVVAQADLAANVAGNGPAFNVYLNTLQLLTSGNYAKILFDAANFDTASAFDLTTNHRFQPSVAGYYQINLSVRLSTNAVASSSGIEIRKTGNALAQNYLYATASSASSPGTLSTSCLIYLNGTTDYVEGWAFITATNPFLSATSVTSLSGFLARAA